MPLISIVMPVHGVSGYVRQCLDSILGQSFTDLEIIAVDDASPDDCGEILDEYASLDPRVRVLHLTENLDAGPARAQGLARAAGEYLWFVDSDDWIPDGALKAIAARLRETRPDMLIVDHARVWWDGRIRSSGLETFLPPETTPDTFRARDHSGVFKVFPSFWGRIVSRALLDRAGLEFYPGYYEDVPFTFPLLAAAERISVMRRVCYFYRQRRIGAATASVGTRHFEVFGQYEKTFETFDRWGLPQDDPARKRVFDFMLWHYRWILGASDRIAKHLQPIFFARMSQHYQRYGPDPTIPESRGTALKLHLIATNNWQAFNAIRRVQRAARVVMRGRELTTVAVSRVVDRLHRLAGLAYYHWQRTMSVEPDLAVYSAYWDRGYACSPAAVYETARKLAPDVHGVWIVDRDAEATMPPGVPYVLKGSMTYYRVLGRARYLVNNVNFPGFLVKRPGTVHLQTHHGTPLKTMGMQHYEHPIGARGVDLQKMLKRCDRWDFSVSTSPFNTAVWQRAYPCRHEVLEVGYPRNDRLCTATAADVAAARRALGIEPDERTILYVPTHREYQPGFRSPLDVGRLADTLGAGNRILARIHYFHGNAFGQFADVHPRVLDVSEHPRIEDLYLAADVLVTDYSSAMFDYAILDRPIVIFAPDWEAYRDARGVNFDLMARPPGLVARTQEDLVLAFQNKTIDGTDARNARAEFRRRFCPHRDGTASELVVRRVFLAERESALDRAGMPRGPGDKAMRVGAGPGHP